MDVAHVQSLHITLLRTALQDTEHWDPTTCPRPSFRYTPSQGHQVLDRSGSPRSASPLQFCLSNCFDVLSQSGITLANHASLDKCANDTLQRPGSCLWLRGICGVRSRPVDGVGVGSWARLRVGSARSAPSSVILSTRRRFLKKSVLQQVVSLSTV